jgi:hypothetical protein
MSNKPSASINLGLSAIPEVDSPELYGSLVPVYNALRKIMYALDAYTGNSLVTPDEYKEVNPVRSALSNALTGPLPSPLQVISFPFAVTVTSAFVVIV